MIDLVRLVRCDTCPHGTFTPFAAWTSQEAREAAAANGWTRKHVKAGPGSPAAYEDRCPTCSANTKEQQ